jgi:hypothetical protein
LPEEMSHLVALEKLWLNGNRLSPKAQERLQKLLPHTNIDFGHQVHGGNDGESRSDLKAGRKAGRKAGGEKGTSLILANQGTDNE